MNWRDVEAIPPAMKSVVPVTAAFRAWMEGLSRGVVAILVDVVGIAARLLCWIRESAWT